jgi:uncharacterized protein YjbI with pentapeptide repeats
MVDQEQLDILLQGADAWNAWRIATPGVIPDFSGVELSEENLSGANLSGINLSEANLYYTNLQQANLSGANLFRAHLDEAILRGADLSGANLREAHLSWWDLGGRATDLSSANLSETDFSGADLRKANLGLANLSKANLSMANLSEANLRAAILLETNFEGANLSRARIYGVSAWNVKLNADTKQNDLIISQRDEPMVMVDDLEVAQFVYLLLNNEKIRSVIDTVGDKGVLILGRFTEDRKAVLDAIRNRLRELGFIPIMFDFERPSQRDFTETIRTLAGLSRFIIADITNPKSSPLELQAIMPDYMIPFVPIIHENEEPFAMFRDLKTKYSEWVLDVLEYDSAKSLIQVLDKAVVRPALIMADQLIFKKAETIRKRHVKEYQ